MGTGGHSPGQDDRLTYEDWARLLASYFFGDDAEGHPVRFCPDEETLAELSGRDEDAAVESLVSCVRTRLSVRHAYNIFERGDKEALRWKLRGRGVGDPPFLPMLAVAVLAAVRMARSDGVASHNYYLRFNELIGLPGRREPKGYGDTFPDLWRTLEWWLSDVHHGRRGISTIQADPNRPHQGFAISQALLRRSDRQRLTFFFHWMGLDPSEPAHPEELLARFKAWAPNRPGLSPGLQYMVANDEYDARLSSALAAEAARWDGSLRDEHGRRVALLHFTLRLNPRLELGLIAPRPEGFPASARFTGPGGSEVELSSSEAGWYDQQLPDSLVVIALKDGLRLISGDVVLQIKPDFVIPFRGNRELGCWTSVRQLVPKEDHWVLGSQKHARELVAFLSAHAVEGWSKQACGPPLDQEWSFFRNVTIDTVPASTSSEALARLLPSPTNRASLQGGLPMPGHHYFLVGGEPDLWVPPGGPGESSVELSIDGISEQVRPGSLIALSKRDLPAGVHELKVGGTSLQFRTMETSGAREPAHARSLVHVLGSRDGRSVATGIGVRAFSDEDTTSTCITGSLIFGAPSPGAATDVAPLVLPVGAREIYLIGSKPGEVEQPQQLPPASWLGAQDLRSNRFEWHASFEVVWIVWRPGAGEWRFRLKNSRPCERAEQIEGDIDLWAELFELEGPTDNAGDLWTEYRSAARSIREL